MKKLKIIAVVFMIGFAFSAVAQSGYYHNNYYNQGGNYYNTYNSNQQANFRGHDWRSIDQHLSRRDRRKVQRLRRELSRCYERAWRDGRISRREARKIRELEWAINQYYPRRRDFRRRSYIYNYNRRRTCG